MKRERRQKEAKLRKNFFPSLIIILILWSLVTALIYFASPETFGIIPLFFVLIFLALSITLSTLFANTRRGVISAVAITVFILLRYFGVGNIVNFLLLIGLGIVIELYFSRV
ncbi:hypothetical protein A2714_03430 [Candidatus Woesebacteria bacterium RIFCSPHIGHO2_01_FULL_38_9]|uniref:Uncharacterized protein n=2 Tax=Candidatus Woeseibacteriota TaxID=1752722 RepID=A0A1F7Y1Z9_9BACT|nr:MAG: hypothetical protein A2714_03430 [Candidatus Woesebacteria bacterium RIFCSPHIGHO2_01_FULL_38_9]OGM63896.1 MAG: hypothetical protein A2893_00065 [Candidatus Woesebacteria bacterium RIFCSPLOWO2_01_FULL_39_25]